MNIAILSRSSELYSTQSLANAARKRHHNVRIIDYVNCDLIIKGGTLSISYHGQIIKNVDAIIPRIGTTWTDFGASVIRQFELLNVFTSLNSEALVKARNKLNCAQILTANGINIPKTIVSNNDSAYKKLLTQFSGDQVIIKLLNGTHGNGVFLADNKKQAESILDSMSRIEQNAMMQEFIGESKGSDIRIFVVDGEIVGSIKRQSKPGEFRSNLHLGGSSTIEEISDIEKEIAIRAVTCLGLNIAGVDMLRSKKGPLILEVNASPGLEGIETTTKMDIASRIINFVEKNALITSKSL